MGVRICLSQTLDDIEWKVLYDMAKKQSLVGICFAAVQMLPEDERPSEMLYLTWMGMAAKIQQRNEVVNRQCFELQKRLATDGFRSYIMKGQSVAALYGERLSGLRQSGDIDIFLEGGYDKIVKYVQKTYPTNEINEVEVHYPIFSDTEVEIHYRPFKTRNPFTNKRIQAYFDSVAERELTNRLSLPDGCGEIYAPTIEFNLIHQLGHIHKHLFTEGVGLRQLMDYYFVLRTSYDSSTELRSQNKNVLRIVRELNLTRFASALMWGLGHVFGLERECMLWEPNEKDGQFLLNEIILSGNFGKQDERQKGLYDSKWNSFWMVHFKTFRFRRFDRWAWFWSPLWRIYTFMWRLIKGYK